MHFEPIPPRPSEVEYKAISQKIVDTYPSLKDTRKSDYWVSTIINIMHQVLLVLASYPGPLIEGEEKGPGTYCMCMRQPPQENLGCREQYAFLLSSRT